MYTKKLLYFIGIIWILRIFLGKYVQNRAVINLGSKCATTYKALSYVFHSSARRCLAQNCRSKSEAEIVWVVEYHMSHTCLRCILSCLFYKWYLSLWEEIICTKNELCSYYQKSIYPPQGWKVLMNLHSLYFAAAKAKEAETTSLRNTSLEIYIQGLFISKG